MSVEVNLKVHDNLSIFPSIRTDMPHSSLKDMSCSIRAMKLKELFAELGFVDQRYPGRDQKDIQKALKCVSFHALRLGDPPKFWKTDSEDAKALATKFCEEHQSLWPANIHGGWPVWSSQREKIIDLVAHVLSLKAHNKYHTNGALRKKNIKSQGAEAKVYPSSSPINQNDLTHQEADPRWKSFGISPHRGTKSLPREHPPQPTVEEDDETSDGVILADSSEKEIASTSLAGMFLDRCLEHIASLDPKNQPEILTDFSRKWLADTDADCPRSADRRMILFMHENDSYCPGGEEVKIVSLMKKLRKGTELEALQSGIQYTQIEPRVLKRLKELSNHLFEDGFIKHDENYNWSKDNKFREYWEKREVYWDNSELETSDDEQIGDDSPAILDDSSASTSMYHTKQNQPLFKVCAGRSRHPERSNTADELVESTFNDTPNKRRKTTGSNSSPRMSQSASDDCQGRSTARAYSSAAADDNIIPEDSLPTQESDFLPDSIPTPQHNGRHSFYFSGGESTTPDIEAVPEGSPSRVMRSGDGIRAQPQEQLRSHVEVSILDEHTPVLAYPKAIRGIFFTIRDKDHKYDLEKPVSAACIREVSLSSLFVIVSQHSGIPLHTIDRMTLKSIFAKKYVKNIVDILHRDAEEQAWYDVKEKIKRRYEFVLDNDPRQEKFEILVDVGDFCNVALEDMDAGAVLW